MSHKYEYAPITRVLAKLTRDLGLQSIDESDVIEWVGEALEAIASAPFYEPAVAFVEVRNHQAELPNGIAILEQIARNNCWTGPKGDAVCPVNVLKEIAEVNDNTPNCNTLPIPLDCKGMPLMDYDLAYYRPYYDLQSEYYGWTWRGSTLYNRCFTPIRKATGNFFLAREQMAAETSGIVSSVNNCNSRCNLDEYTIIGKKTARFSFKEGQAAISYLRQVVDPETGYPMIPDTFSHKTAITMYITYMMMKREFYAGREGAGGRMSKAESDWQWYCKQASNLDLMPHGIDDHQNLYDSRTRLLPNNKQYYSFFGKMSVPEGRKWDDPDWRNYSVNYFRGAGAYANY